MLGDNAVTAESLLSQPNLAQPYSGQAKRLTVALVSDIKPYQFYEQQQAQGYIADWWRLWGQANGYEIEFKMTTGQNSVDLVVQGQADLHGGIENVSSLATAFYFSKPIISIQSELFLTRDVISTKLIESLYPYVVGVIKGAAVIDMLATQYPKFKLTIYSSRHELLEAVKFIDPSVEVIMITAYGTVEVAVGAMKKGAYDFISKPLQKIQVIKAVHKALEKRKLLSENIF